MLYTARRGRKDSSEEEAPWYRYKALKRARPVEQVSRIVDGVASRVSWAQMVHDAVAEIQPGHTNPNLVNQQGCLATNHNADFT
jgi:hypothetical protein